MAALYSLECPQDREVLDSSLNPRLSPDSCGVYQQVTPAVPLHQTVYSVSGCSWYIRYQDPLVAKDPVDQSRFTGIGFPDHGYSQIVFYLRFRFLVRKVEDEFIQKFRYSGTVKGRDRKYLPQSKPVELGGLQFSRIAF